MRLRRSPFAFLAYGGGAAVLAVGFSCFMIWAIPKGELALAPLLVASLVVVGVWLSGRVELRPDELRAGTRFRPERIPRADILRSQTSSGSLGRAVVRGIVLECSSEDRGAYRAGLRLSGGLSEAAHFSWRQSIDRWASGNDGNA